MNPSVWQKVLELCNSLSNVTYENLTKIIRLEQTGSASGARNLDDSNQNDVDAWMGGGTCFSMTWHLYQNLKDMGLKPRLVMGHKRKERNIHCALILPDAEFNEAHLRSANQNNETRLRSANQNVIASGEAAWQSSEPFSREYLLDPGYLLFEPLELPLPTPFGQGTAFFPLVPNTVRLDRPSMESLALWTGGAGGPMKLRFEYPVAGVSVEEFKQHWAESFYREMMTYPVLNRLDRERGVQYYYQKGNLVTRDANGSRMERIATENQVETLSSVFRLSPEIIEKALGILGKKG